MNGNQDFVIENGVLKKYTGPGGEVVIPEGVTEIGWGPSRTAPAYSRSRSQRDSPQSGGRRFGAALV